MKMDYVYTNGVIAALEKCFLKDRILKMCESTLEDAFRILTESGFGKIPVDNVYDYEKLIINEEISLGAFIKEYAPSDAESAYFLATRDFHNLKALIKAEYMHISADKMLAPEGEVSIELLKECVKDKSYYRLEQELKDAAEKAEAALNEFSSGADIGIIFDRALFAYLLKKCTKNRTLKKLLSDKADMTNIITAMRSADGSFFEKSYLSGGNIPLSEFKKLFSSHTLNSCDNFNAGEFNEFYLNCLEAKQEFRPLTAAERMCDSYDFEYFFKRRYDLQKDEPFLFYVFRKQAEIADVRIVFVCLMAEMPSEEIKKRLRGV